MRTDGRSLNQLRNIKITPHVAEFAEGSALVEFGKTKVLCTVSYEPKAPQWLMGSGEGWITAEYGMLPRSTQQRIKREKAATGGRTQEISRIIGRSLRACLDMSAIGERQLIVDCDVLHADGGTRTASVTGGFVALAMACKKLMDVGEFKSNPLRHYVAAVSVGLQNGKAFLDLNYDEDSSISTDMNFVMTEDGRFVEIQGTGEEHPFSKEEFMSLMEMGTQGCQKLFEIQAQHVGHIFPLKVK